MIFELIVGESKWQDPVFPWDSTLTSVRFFTIDDRFDLEIEAYFERDHIVRTQEFYLTANSAFLPNLICSLENTPMSSLLSHQ